MTIALTLPVPLPAGARCISDWEADVPQPYRAIEAVHRKITDHRLTVAPSAVQWADGSVDDGRIEGPHIYVYRLDDEGSPLNSDQARELAAALLESAAEIDGWAHR